MPDQQITMDQVSEFFDDESLEVIKDISVSDGMHMVLPDLYFTAGRDALRSIRLAMLAGKLTRVNRVLDFASGSGRVMRYLKAAFPNAELTACDVLKEDLAFCSEAFGATIVEGKLKPDEVELDGPFDLIWCGSLLSHTDRDDFVGVLGLFDSLLSPGGVAVFTAMGRSIAEGLRTGRSPLSLSRGEAEQVVRDYDETGFGFIYGIHNPDAKLGEAVASPSWVCKQLDQTPELLLLLYLEKSWLGQDVIACTKANRGA